MSVAGLERITTRSVAKHLTLSRHTGRRLNSHLKASVDVSHWKRKFYAEANTVLQNFSYHTDGCQMYVA